MKQVLKWDKEEFAKRYAKRMDELKKLFVPENIKKVVDLNAKIRKEELRSRNFYRKLAVQLQGLQKNGEIDDYIINHELLILSKDVQCSQRNNVELGDPLYTEHTSLLGFFENESFDENWNELNSDHPLSHLFFCYTMHCVAFHSKLDWEDILCIDNVVLEVNVIYQYITDKVEVTKWRR